MTRAEAVVSLTVVTYGRERVLIESLERLLALRPPATEVLVVDQSPRHDPPVESALDDLDRRGTIRWIRLPEPSIPVAMNEALVAARGEVVLFVDDDVDPTPGLVGAHLRAHQGGGAEIVAGQVLQPGETPASLVGRSFRFNSSVGQPVTDFMGGNFSVRRGFALAVGGFDQNFVGAAYRFESEFAARARRAGGRIYFEPEASLRHLRASEGGIRALGDHLRRPSPVHSVGEYYFLLGDDRGPWQRWRQVMARPLRAVHTRYHLRHPWKMPAMLHAELRGLLWALRLRRQGPRLLSPDRGAPPS